MMLTYSMHPPPVQALVGFLSPSRPSEDGYQRRAGVPCLPLADSVIYALNDILGYIYPLPYRDTRQGLAEPFSAQHTL